MTRVVILFIFAIVHFSVMSNENTPQLPVEAFGKLPEASQVKLSPDGNSIAFIRHYQGSTFVGVTDLIKKKVDFPVQTDNEMFKIGWYVWANNHMLLVSADYPVTRFGQRYTETRLIKVDTNDIDKKIETVMKPKRKERSPQFQNNIIDLLPNDPDHILMSLDLKRANTPDVYKVNLNSSRKRSMIYKGKSHIYDWLTDRQHRLRLGFGRDETKVFFRLYDLATKEWRNIWEYEIFDAPDITPLGFGLNPNHLYIRANHQGRYALFKVDVSKKELPRELVYADKNYDIEGSLIYSQKTNDVVGVYHGEADDSKVFFDSEHAAFQKALNDALPDSYNNITSMSADERKYILFNSNSETPGAYYFGNRDKNTLEFVLQQYPLLFDQKLSGKNKVTYKARDELQIEAYITLPHGGIKENSPAIILPHGGPMTRNYAGFDWFSEFFASRGYTVLEPNFRGSSGYGFQFEMESIKKWGGAMQDDLADAAHWLSDNYTIDKNKICIIGASYGGYAALMAAVKQQDTFKCAASFAGVSDLEYILRKARKFTNSEVVKKQFGTDDDLLEENSPVNFAEKINIPVLLIHGDKDRVVDVKHSQKMYSELKDYKKDVQYIELENGNHHLEIEAHRLKTLSSIDTFLAEHLK